MESKPKLIVMPSERGGRGVFTTIALEKSSIIEVSPVIVIPPVDVPKIHHAIYPNLDYEMDFELNTISFVALQDIDPWTELTINYNGKSGDSQEVWFKIN